MMMMMMMMMEIECSNVSTYSYLLAPSKTLKWDVALQWNHRGLISTLKYVRFVYKPTITFLKCFLF